MILYLSPFILLTWMIIFFESTPSDASSSASSSTWGWTKLYTYNTNPDDQGNGAGPVIEPSNLVAITSTADTGIAFNSSSGEGVIWNWYTPSEAGEVGSPPTLIGNSGRVAFTLDSSDTGTQNMCVVDSDTGKHQCCWSTPAESGRYIVGRVNAYLDTIMVGITSPGEVKQINPKTCDEIWSVETIDQNPPSDQITASEELETIYWCDTANHIQYVKVGATKTAVRQIPNACSADGGALGVKQGAVYAAGPNTDGTIGRFYKYFAETGQILWSFKTSDTTDSSMNYVAFWKDEIVFACMADGIYAFNINGTGGIDNEALRWSYKLTTGAAFYGPPAVIGDSEERNANSNNRFAEFYRQVIIAPSTGGAVLSFDPFNGTLLWEGVYNDQTETSYAPVAANGSVWLLDNAGLIHAYSPCAGYDEQDCPMACRVLKNGCGCHQADENSCKSTFLSRRCQWCPEQNMCGYKAGILSPASVACDCSFYNHDTCVIASGGCKWCTSQNLCSNTQRPDISWYNYDCDCRTYSSDRCSRAGSTNCRFCSGSTDQCTFANLPCECLWINQEKNCDMANQSRCGWCPNTKTCSPLPVVPPSSPDYNPMCSCNAFNKSVCTSFASPGCSWCERFGPSLTTITPNTEPPLENGVCASSCECSTLDTNTCQQVEKESSGTVCKFCADTIESCIDPNRQSCSCSNFDKAQCLAVQESSGACAFCQQAQICVNLFVNGTHLSNDTACECKNFDKQQCRLANFNANGACKYCHNFDTCVDGKQECTCELFSLDSCETAIKSGVCKICHDQKICTNAVENANCSCNFYQKATCQKTPSTQCVFCENTATCESNVDALHQKYPTCSCYSYSHDFEKCKLASDCAIFEGVLGVQSSSSSAKNKNKNNKNKNSSSSSSRGEPFCAPSALDSCAPTSCTSIGADPQLCDVAGCRLSSSDEKGATCVGSEHCFTFFLDEFVPQSWFLLILGVFKDVIVLVALGATDIVQRTSAKIVQRASRWFKRKYGGVAVEHKIIPDRMDETVYICDTSCRDGDMFKDYGDFSSHVWKVCDELFFWSSEPTASMKQKLFDAVAFSLVNNQSWVALSSEEVAEEEGGHATNPNPPVASVTPTATNSSALLNADDRQFSVSDISNNDPSSMLTAGSQCSANNDSPTFARIHEKAKQRKRELRKKRRKLRPQTLERNEPQFFKIVDNVVVARTNYYIFYSHSRELSKRISSSINLFPDSNTLLFYVLGLAIMFASALVTVSSVNSKKTIQFMTNGCGSLANFNSTDNRFDPQPNNPWWWTTTSSPSSSDHSNNIDTQQYGSSYGAAFFFLIGYRFMNASSFATACLVLVKYIRGLAQKRSAGGLEALPIEEKIPILTVSYSLGVQILLAIYSLLVLPFALTGLFYGFPSKGWECGLPLLIGFAVIIVDLIIVRNFTSLHSSSDDYDPFQSSEVGDEEDVGERLLQQDDDDKNEAKTKEIKKKKTLSGLSHSSKRSQKKQQSLLEGREENDDNAETKTEELVVSPRHEAAVNDDDDTNNNKSNNDDDDDDDGVNEDDIKDDNFYEDAREVQRELDEEKEASRSLFRAIVLFLLTQELPTIVICLALQMSFNYTALLEFPREFALEGKPQEVFARDAAGRSLSCTFGLLEGDISAVMSDLSSFLPFM